MTTLSFWGAAETVTGSKYLIESPGARILVDCGMFQGLKELRERNWQDPPFDPKSIDAILITHAHIDHTGYLPRLVAQGYKGPVYCSRGTADLIKILLPDAGRLQELRSRDIFLAPASSWLRLRMRAPMEKRGEPSSLVILDIMTNLSFVIPSLHPHATFCWWNRLTEIDCMIPKILRTRSPG